MKRANCHEFALGFKPGPEHESLHRKARDEQKVVPREPERLPSANPQAKENPERKQRAKHLLPQKRTQLVNHTGANSLRCTLSSAISATLPMRKSKNLTPMEIAPLFAPGLDELEAGVGRLERVARSFPILGWWVAWNAWQRRTAPIVSDVSAQLSARSPTDPEVWGPDPRRQELAFWLCVVAKQEMAWPNDHFIPTDPARIIFWSHEDGLDFDCALLEIHHRFGLKIPRGEANSWFRGTFGDVVDDILIRLPDGDIESLKRSGVRPFKKRSFRGTTYEGLPRPWAGLALLALLLTLFVFGAALRLWKFEIDFWLIFYSSIIAYWIIPKRLEFFYLALAAVVLGWFAFVNLGPGASYHQRSLGYGLIVAAGAMVAASVVAYRNRR